MELALNLAVNEGYARIRSGFFAPGFDYQRIRSLGKLTAEVGAREPRFAEIDTPGAFHEPIDDRTILSFTINFEPNQDKFPPDVYGSDFQKAMEVASTYGNAVLTIRGHADPTKVLSDLVRAGMNKGIIQRSGSAGNYKYFIHRRPLDLEATEEITRLLEGGDFAGADPDPRETMQAALNLSLARAKAVRDAIIQYAGTQGVRIDESQLQPAGVGVREPLIARPKNLQEAKENMRVEFRIVKVPAEAIQQSDFDF
jgi:outer membrane protein OmpA-like peptidoglycan-associated protein